MILVEENLIFGEENIEFRKGKIDLGEENQILGEENINFGW